jgi:tRNA modification GTPase
LGGSDKDTICAVSTPPGAGGIGIVRISGTDAVGVASKIIRLKSYKVGDYNKISGINYGWVVNPVGEVVIDEVLVSFMRAPATYTREDVVEINCHGGHAVVSKVLGLAIEAGARLAEPGEFTKRAFLNGRIDLTQAEAVMDVISSSTELALRSAMEQLEGGLRARVESLREGISELLAMVEASIDFPDEELEAVPAAELRKLAEDAAAGIDGLLSGYKSGRVLRDGLRVAIVGLPNVGKSSLLNRLCGSDRAIVTEVPGTTRDTLEELVDIGGIPVKLLDTAGIRHSEDIVEKEGVRRTERAIAAADLVLLVLDLAREQGPDDLALAVRVRDRRHIAVWNKSDLPSIADTAQIEGVLSGGDKASVSAKTGEGVEALVALMREEAMGGQAERQPEAYINLRHRDALDRAKAAIGRFLEGVDDGLSPELLAVELREALDAVGEVVGATTPDDVLDIIFSRFCIGK